MCFFVFCWWGGNSNIIIAQEREQQHVVAVVISIHAHRGHFCCFSHPTTNDDDIIRGYNRRLVGKYYCNLKLQ